MRKQILLFTALLAVFAVLISAGCVTTDSPGDSEGMVTITDAFGRDVTIPENPEKIAVVGSGSMRYFVYLGIDLDDVCAVDYQDSKLNIQTVNVRPYALANPEILEIPEVGAAKGVVDNEKLLMSGAEILFMGGASSSNTEVANEIQEKTGIPVVMFYTGNYVTDSEKIQDTLLMLGEILNKEQRAKDLIAYFDAVEADLKKRVAGLSAEETVYVGGVSYNGVHGLDGTDPTYYPFAVLNIKNAAAEVTSVSQTGYAQISKEKLLEWDPEIIFVDLNTMEAAGGGGIYELQNDPAYKGLSAVKSGKVFAVNPHTSMGTNHETSMANAYYIGTILYPEQFSDIDPAKKADEIYTFVDGAPVYEQLKENMGGLSYQKLSL
ncbi:MAG: ABC transporter substrate-binding protein [Methanocorpusculum sp.]|nr:ABC transporter substrate-binding protein [Methanocorpusculum sp.]HJJ62563.1 ABC transporter substrate-binding protein [Methanocorpusculum sp.]HJJ73879.1 ABC transporter substrate-binding protein [Methanocorpusculum sp.]